MITMGSPYFVWINANKIISSWYLLDAVCVTPPGLAQNAPIVRGTGYEVDMSASSGASSAALQEEGEVELVVD